MNREPLLAFYFGSLNEEDRLTMEREMLTDPVVLLDYLELKRELEAAPAVPSTASPQVWQRLKLRLPQSRRARLSWTVGVAALVAAALLFFVLPQKPTANAPTLGKGILFDSDREQFDHSNVL